MRKELVESLCHQPLIRFCDVGFHLVVHLGGCSAAMITDITGSVCPRMALAISVF